MEVNRKCSKWTTVVMLACVCGLASCRAGYEVTKVEGARVAMDAAWDAEPMPEAVALLEPYRLGMDSLMGQVKGVAAVSMDRYRPESPLSNLIADVLRQSADRVLGKPADVGIMNIGGIRNSLTEGDITTANVYEILPFENALCVLTMKGSVLKQLFANLAARHGEGVSGIRLEMTKDGRLLDGTVDGQPVQDDKDYTVATIDYLTEGNDGLTALPLAHEKVCPQGAVLRDLFMDYVKSQAAAGKPVTARIEGRVVVKE